MDTDLKDLPLEKLLSKFGAGSHKPGSGSAAALLGLLSCKLIKTVISLTLGKTDDAGVIRRLNSINDDVESCIEPKLWRYFQEDSERFHSVIVEKRLRDQEDDQHERWKLADEAIEKLKPATNIPLNIARHCIDLAEHSITVFDDGFKAARGDSEVALDSALSGVTGSLSIVYLNLSNFQGREWETGILKKVKNIEEKAQDLQNELIDRIEILKDKAIKKNENFNVSIGKLRDPSITKDEIPVEQIEKIAKNIQNEIWKGREEVWGSEDIGHIDAINTSIAFEIIGYRLLNKDFLGQSFSNGKNLEVAGYINRLQKFACVSDQFNKEVRKFTSAHELGHALLHDFDEKHRDRPLDGSSTEGTRPRVEFEADKFAAFFLMPANTVRQKFFDIFGVEKFEIDEETAFALVGKSVRSLREECNDDRDLSRILAKTNQYKGQHIVSLSERFGVTVEAMAIRLEELNLFNL